MLPTAGCEEMFAEHAVYSVGESSMLCVFVSTQLSTDHPNTSEQGCVASGLKRGGIDISGCNYVDA